MKFGPWTQVNKRITMPPKTSQYDAKTGFGEFDEIMKTIHDKLVGNEKLSWRLRQLKFCAGILKFH